MNAVALIVEHETPDLLALCLASLKRFAPEVRPLVLRGYEGAAAHAVEIEAARRHQKLGDAEIVILLDTDTVILSDDWWLGAKEQVAAGMNAIGGLRHRGDVTQLYCRGDLLLHAHCLVMKRSIFDRVPSFAASGLWDTTWQVSSISTDRRTPGHPDMSIYIIVPQSGDGWPPRVGLYASSQGILWAHLGRGTSFRPRGPWRERIRRASAAMGSKRAQKILSYQQDRAEFLRKGWEIVNA